jgi:hypothetical protein
MLMTGPEDITISKCVTCIYKVIENYFILVKIV